MIHTNVAIIFAIDDSFEMHSTIFYLSFTARGLKNFNRRFENFFLRSTDQRYFTGVNFGMKSSYFGNDHVEVKAPVDNSALVSKRLKIAWTNALEWLKRLSTANIIYNLVIIYYITYKHTLHKNLKIWGCFGIFYSEWPWMTSKHT